MSDPSKYLDVHRSMMQANAAALARLDNPQPCGCCSSRDAARHMSKCGKCGRLICSRCLYVPTIQSPIRCPECRNAHP